MVSAISLNNQQKWNKTSFKARPLANYGFLIDKNLTIFQLQQHDIGYIKHILKYLDIFYKKYEIFGESARQVLEEAGYNITQEEFYEIMQIYSMHSLLIGKRGNLA